MVTRVQSDTVSSRQSKSTSSPLVFIIDDSLIMADCIARAARGTSAMPNVLTFGDAIAAMGAIAAGQLPDLIFLEVLLSGPDAFTFLNELLSYEDTAKVPIVVVSSLDFATNNLADYNVVGYLNKETMTPQEIQAYVAEYTHA